MTSSHPQGQGTIPRKASRQTAAAVEQVVAELLEPRKLLAAGVSGAVFVDLDNDAKLDSREVGIAGVTVTLTGTMTSGGAVKLTAKTDAQGRFLFSNLAPGVYKVTETQPAGYPDGKDATGFLKAVVGNDVISNIILGASGTCFVTFGERPKPAPTPPPPPPPSSISGFAYHDLNNNGIKESGEAGITGVPIKLTGTRLDGSTVNLTTTTNASGFYEFKGLSAGTYQIVETQPAAYIDGKDAVGSLGGTLANDLLSSIVLAAGKNGVNYNFGELTPGCIGGVVFVDTDRDGVFDTNERPLANVLITLTGVDDRGVAVTATTRTDANGAYRFNGLRPGTYKIAQAQPAGYRDGQSIVGSAGGTAAANLFSEIRIGSGICALNYNFSELLDCGCPPVGGGDSDGGSDGKSDGGSDGKSDGGSDGKSDGHSDGKSDGGSDGKSDGGSDGKSDGGSDGKSDGGSDGKSDGGSDGKSDGHSDGKSDGGSDGKSDGGSDGKSDGGSDGKSDGGSDGKSDGKSDGGSDGHSDGGKDKYSNKSKQSKGSGSKSNKGKK